MKLNIKKFFAVLGLATLLYSCDTTNESGYVPAEYTSPTTFTITENATATSDNSFVVVYTPASPGKAYYAVVTSGTSAPTSTQVHGGSGFLQSGSFNVDGTTPVNITVNKDVYGAYTYDVYAIHKSTDNFISETVTKLSVTTPDTAAPTFDRDNSAPAFTSAGINPFAPVTLQFSEPVFYQGGDINFTAFDGGSGLGRKVTVNSASALSTSGSTVTINTHGTFQQSDFNIVTWGPDTFKDKAGKSVAPLTGFGHYFSTRAFTAPEAALLMQGTYNYDVVFYGGLLENFYTPNAALFLPSTGQFELKLDPSDATGTTLLGINVFSPLLGFGFADTPTNLKIKFGAGGALAVLSEPQLSGIPVTAGGAPLPVIWNHWMNGFTPFPGFYDVSTGEIGHYLSIVAAGGSGPIIDDMDYNYTRIGTFAKSTPEVVKNLKERNELLQKKLEQHKTYKAHNYKTIKLIK